jgi:hypothetical protein
MKKLVLLLVVALVACLAVGPAFAGGVYTNANASFGVKTKGFAAGAGAGSVYTASTSTPFLKTGIATAQVCGVGFAASVGNGYSGVSLNASTCTNVTVYK